MFGFQLCVLGSSSSGNATYISAGGTGLLIDAGFSAREIERRLAAIGAEISGIHAVCLSHEHRDHTAGLAGLCRRHGIPVYANRGTAEGLRGGPRENGPLPVRHFTTGSDFTVGALTLHPFAVPHDAYEPVGFVVGWGEIRVAVTTDLGMPTALVRERLRECRAIVLEANHDPDMLRQSSRPWSLKQRILGRQGHLSNQHAAELLDAVASPRLEQVFLAHLSQECNAWELALDAARQAVSGADRRHIRISPTYPDRAAEVWRPASEAGREPAATKPAGPCRAVRPAI